MLFNSTVNSEEMEQLNKPWYYKLLKVNHSGQLLSAVCGGENPYRGKSGEEEFEELEYAYNCITAAPLHSEGVFIYDDLDWAKKRAEHPDDKNNRPGLKSAIYVCYPLTPVYKHGGPNSKRFTTHAIILGECVWNEPDAPQFKPAHLQVFELKGVESYQHLRVGNNVLLRYNQNPGTIEINIDVINSLGFKLVDSSGHEINSYV